MSFFPVEIPFPSNNEMEMISEVTMHGDHAETLIFGAGPVGLLMASELARHGVSSILVEEEPSGSPRSENRQLVIHPCTRALMADLGILDELLELSQPLQHIRCYVDHELLHVLDLEKEGQIPPLLVEEQDLTRLLREYLLIMGVSIHPHQPLQSYTESSLGIEAVVGENDETSHTVKARWTIETRKKPFRHDIHQHDNFFSLNYLSPLLRVDVEMDWELPPTETVLFASDDVVAICLPSSSRGLEHWWINVPKAFNHIDEPPGLKEIEEILKEVVPFPFKLNNLLSSRWKPLHAHLARKYRQDRTFFVGQSACYHPSLLGQELHMGLQDAYNLAWKMGLVNRGEACPTILETYHAERAFLGQEWWDQADPLFRRTFLSPSVPHLQTRQVFSKKECLFRLFHPFLTPLNQNYTRSPIVKERCCQGYFQNQWKTGPKPGERAPDGLLILHGGATATLYERCWGSHHTLLLFEGLEQSHVESGVIELAQELQCKYGDLLHVKVLCHSPSDNLSLDEEMNTTLDPEGRLHHRYGALKPCLYLLRPDNYVGFRCMPIDEQAFEQYWKQLTHPVCHTAL